MAAIHQPPPQSLPYDYLFKVLIIGDASVGKVRFLAVEKIRNSMIRSMISLHCILSLFLFFKSSILLRFTDDSFDEHIQSTIGVDFKVKHLEVDGKRVKLTIWDTAGQERFRTLTSSYYRGAHGVVLVYDVTRIDSFESLENWLKEVQMYSPGNGESVVKLLVGNKCDLDRKVGKEQADAWARSQGMLFLEASAKTRLGIRQVFMEVVKKMLENPDVIQNAQPGKPRIQLRPQNHPDMDDDEGGCC
jgi:Ras-related protein Rab-18